MQPFDALAGEYAALIARAYPSRIRAARSRSAEIANISTTNCKYLAIQLWFGAYSNPIGRRSNMRRASLSLIFFTLAGIVALSAPVHAQATRTWVSGVGDDANPCSRTAPCKTFAGAISKTVASGEINCLDPGGFGGVTITKAISLVCESVEGGVLVAGTNGITVAAGAADIVVLRGLDIQGTGSGLDGVKFITGAELRVEKCVIRGFLAAPGNGIHFAPTGTSKIFVLDSIIADNSQAATSAGILIQPTGSGTALGTIEGVRMLNNGNGIIVDGTQSTGATMFIVVRNSLASGNTSNGVSAVSAAGNAPARIIFDHSAAAVNNIGISSSGQGADITMAYSNVSGNNTVGNTFTAPASLRSYQNNELIGNNIANGTPSGTLPLE
jgi:hypothetical protein